MKAEQKIREHPLLQGLPEEAVQRLSSGKSYSKEHVLFKQGKSAFRSARSRGRATGYGAAPNLPTDTSANLA